MLIVCEEMLRLGSVGFRHCRGLLSRQSGGAVSIDQPSCGLKRSVEEKLGLPPRPKKPLSPYFRFMAQVRPSIIRNNPDAKITELVKIIAAEWEKADPALREDLKKQFNREMTDYHEEYTKYVNKLTPQQLTVIQETRQQLQLQKEKRMLNKKIREMGRPKKPLSPFLRFLNSHKRGDVPFKEWQLEMSERWKKMSDKEKEPFMEATQQEFPKYHKNLQEWEERMIRMGHTDIVRRESLIEPQGRSWDASSKRRSQRAQTHE